MPIRNARGGEVARCTMQFEKDVHIIEARVHRDGSGRQGRRVKFRRTGLGMYEATFTLPKTPGTYTVYVVHNDGECYEFFSVRKQLVGAD